MAQVVFPDPAGPANSMWGMLLVRAYAESLSNMLFCPMTSESFLGLYFSTQTSCIAVPDSRMRYPYKYLCEGRGKQAIKSPGRHLASVTVCDKCSRRAVTFVRYSGAHLCASHFCEV